MVVEPPDIAAIEEDLLPDIDNVRNIGSATKRWAALFITTLVLASMTIGTIVLTEDNGLLLINASTLTNGSSNVTGDMTALNFISKGLADCDTINTTSNGTLICGDDEAGGGGGSVSINSSGGDVFANDSTGQYLGKDGTTSSPLYSFKDDTNTGIFSDADGEVSVTLDGTERYIFASTQLKMSNQGSGSFPSYAWIDDINTGMFRNGLDVLRFGAGGFEFLNFQEISQDIAVFNDESGDKDFRWESNNDQNMLFMDSGNNRLGIRTGAPDQTFVVVGDANITGNLTYNTPHGEMFIDLDVTTPIDASGVFFNVTLNNTGDLNGFRHNISNGTLISLQHGDYFVTWSASFTGGANDVYDITLAINLETQAKCESDVKLSAGGAELSNGASCLLEMDDGDELRMVIANQGATNDPTFTHASVVLFRIGQ